MRLYVYVNCDRNEMEKNKTKNKRKHYFYLIKKKKTIKQINRYKTKKSFDIKHEKLWYFLVFI
jgi:hypothetical protein